MGERRAGRRLGEQSVSHKTNPAPMQEARGSSLHLEFQHPQRKPESQHSEKRKISGSEGPDEPIG